jgi:peptidoglycan/LPS O-acetylase OafA/YrhL
MSIQKYPSINGLRAISILFVINHHLCMQQNFFNEYLKNKWLAPVIFFFQDGQFGVNVFFVISGFLITSLMLKEEETYKKISLKDFYIRRTLRIFPAYYFLLFIYFLLQLFRVIEIPSSSWLSALTYTKYFNWQLEDLTAHAWSLSIEEHFYILWPFIFIAGKKIRKIVPVILILAVVIFRTVDYFDQFKWSNELFILKRIDAIALGCLFAFYKDYIITIMSKNWSLFALTAFLYLVFAGKIAQLIGLYNETIVPIFYPKSNTGPISNLAIACIMMYSIFGPKNSWFKFLNLRIINYIGLLSYSIYLWQQLFLLGPKEYFIFNFPQNLVFIIFFSLFSYYIIEKPFLKLKSRFSHSK